MNLKLLFHWGGTSVTLFKRYLFSLCFSMKPLGVYSWFSRERQRERQRDRERETERETDRERDRERDRDRESTYQKGESSRADSLSQLRNNSSIFNTRLLHFHFPPSYLLIQPPLQYPTIIPFSTSTIFHLPMCS